MENWYEAKAIDGVYRALYWRSDLLVCCEVEKNLNLKLAGTVCKTTCLFLFPITFLYLGLNDENITNTL